MTTYRRSILQNILPDNSGDVYYSPFIEHASGDFWKQSIGVFKQDASNVNYLYGSSEIPLEYNSAGTSKIISVWTAAATTGNVQWDFDYRSVAGNDSTSLDQTTAQEQLTVSDAAPSSAFNRLEASMTLTSSNLSGGSTLQWRLGRDGPSESSSMADEALLFDLLLEYED